METSSAIQPLVSVIVPAYNATDHLADALDSLQRQTYSNIEIIVINDGSTDATSEIAHRYTDDPRVTYLEQPNRGVSAARNMGIGHCSGDFITFLDADDTYEPDKVDAQVRLALETPADMVYCNCSIQSSEGAYRLRHDPAAMRSENVLDWLILRNQFPTPSLMFRRETLLQAGRFDETLRSCEDYDLWLRIVSRGPAVAADPRPLVNITYRQGSIFHSNMEIANLIDLHAVLHSAISRESDQNRLKVLAKQARVAERAVWIRRAWGSLDDRPSWAARFLYRSWLCHPKRPRPLLLALLIACPLRRSRLLARQIMTQVWPDGPHSADASGKEPL